MSIKENLMCMLVKGNKLGGGGGGGGALFYCAHDSIFPDIKSSKGLHCG